MYYVYFLASRKNGTIYLGITRDIKRRTWEHKEKLIDGFSKKYGVNKLVYLEEYNSIEAALNREKQLKNWKRCWKMDLIVRDNPEWEDLFLLLV